MKIIDAFWEKRNLGVSCFELNVEHTDTLHSLNEQYCGVEKAEYIVAKIPSSRPDIMSFFHDKGFKFIETILTSSLKISEFMIPKRFSSIYANISISEMTDSDIKKMESEIDKGIFKTDRIYLDSYFKPYQSAERYKYWIRYLISQGHTPYNVHYKEDIVGFFINKIGEETVEGILAGTYKDYEGTGMGFCVQCAGLELYKKMGIKRITGHISCSNPGVVKIVESFGSKTLFIDYVFIKHTDI